LAERKKEMNCTRIVRWLPLYASTDLSDSQAAQVSAHLAQCEACADLANEYVATREWVQGTAAPSFDETFYADLRYAVRQELAAQPVRAAWSWWWKPCAIAVALLLMMILFQMKGVPPSDIVNTHVSPQQPDAVRTPMPPTNVFAQTQKPRVPLRKQGRALRIKQEEKEMTAAAMTTPVMASEVEPMMSRIEIQTADPNIRIIWLTQNTQRVAAEPLTR
jgi:anti-sigma factor RsiW